ncbi:helix-turn-helix domain-containing protein [Sphingomonas bacterium]|uniref:helix-turn-helix domain-containing protein n=1 Tax=Sphingomonas bacterium TaxID=1895847 RepID=UPI0015759986|nr:helix-turn-helix transcriptional regulator [Sphingomonas bacterium]
MLPSRQPARQRYAGPQVRALRNAQRLGQQPMAMRLGISVSYLSQIESGDRPLTDTVLAALARCFPDDWALVDAEEGTSVLVRAAAAAIDPSIAEPLPDDQGMRRTLGHSAALARRLVALHEAVRRGQDQLRVLDDRVEGGAAERGLLPWEEARDWFHDQRNYIDAIDRAAERIAVELADDPTGGASPVARLEARLRTHGIRVAATPPGDRSLRTFDASAATLHVDPAQPPETTGFSMAHQLARLELSAQIDAVASGATVEGGGTSAAARQLLSAGLANYAAGALLMPYAAFRAAARDERHDIDRLRLRFGTSFEQTCHRLSTLQRPGAPGVPFFFCRIDMAGNITKRHSATRLQFARFGGGCPLWIVHEAVAIPDRILAQLAEMPDGARYVSMAKGLVKPSGSYARPPRRYAVALGCEVEHAPEFIYADGLAIGRGAGASAADSAPVPIGVSCRICPRRDCEQRAFPPAAGDLAIDPDRRGAVPYRFS